MSSNGYVVEVERLEKVYPGGTRAVAGIDFVVAEGEFFGFLGPNGAGKSTTMKVLATLLKKTSGRAVVVGADVDREPMEVRRRIGFAMQEVGLDDLAPARDFLMMQGVLYGLSRKEAQRRAAELLEVVGLSEVAGRKVGAYSGGMRRRVDLAAALMHNPPLLILDEPTTGLDPQSRLALWEYLEELNRQGKTIFLTTQIMEEADRLCRRIAIIDHGRIVAEGSPRALKEQVGGDIITVHVAAASEEERAQRLAAAAELARGRSYAVEVNVVNNALSVQVGDGGAAAPDLLRLLHEHGVPVATLSVASPTLDDVFLKYTGRTIRADSADGEAEAQAMRAFLGLGRR